MLAVDEDRVIAKLRELAEFGKTGTGVNRPAFSEADLSARRWLSREMEAAGLETVIDGIGTVYGRSPAKQTILVGSHSDSVPYGGWLDGALGVIFALEVARAARASGSPVGADVISFADEEGTWLPCLGSRVFCGELAESHLQSCKERPASDYRSLAAIRIARPPLGPPRSPSPSRVSRSAYRARPAPRG